MKAKLKNNKGESITEALVSVLIVCLAVFMLCGAIISAGRINSEAGSYNKGFDTTDCTADDFKVKIDDQDYKGKAVISTYYTNEGYYYYDVKSGE
ncbi:MAG: hypothetical protein PUB67_02720 [Clostridiales bacterium]|nr:hypothetical protein [Clostridiales bacterium]